MLKYNRIKILLLSLLIFFCNACDSPGEFHNPIVDLTNNEWAFQKGDNPGYAKKNIRDSNWTRIEVPNKLREQIRYYRGVFWLRKTVDLDISSIKTNLTLYLGKVYEKEEVFFNGTLIGQNANGAKHAMGRERIYNIPANLLKNGENTIAIKVTTSLFNKSKIITGPIVLSSFNSSVAHSIQKYYPQLAFNALFLGLSILFFIYYIITYKQEIIFFTIFILLYSIYLFTKNEIRLQLYDGFLFFNYLGYLLLFLMPWFYIKFIEKFLGKQFLKYSYVYLGINAVFGLLILFLGSPVAWDNIWNVWSFHLIFLVGYAVFLCKDEIRNIKLNFILILFSNIYLAYVILKEIFLNLSFISGTSSLSYSIPVIIFTATFVIRGQNFLESILARNKFKNINQKSLLKENIYPTLDSLLSPNLQELKNMIEPVLENPEKTEPGFVENLYFVQTEIHSDAEDVVRLTQLKLIDELTDKQNILFIDFAKEILFNYKIPYTIKIDENFQVNSNPEYIKMLIISLLEYPAFVNFETNDLMVTSDLKNHIHLRFMMFHRNIQITHNIYKEFSTNIHDSSASSIRWQIILELLRLIGGKVTVNLIRKKYLWLDIQINAFLVVAKEDKQPKQIDIKQVKELASKIDIKEIFIKLKNKLPLKKRKEN